MKYILPLLLLLTSYSYAQLTAYDSMLVGKSVYDFELTNEQGEVLSLKKYSGKYLYIDFWFSGCKPCIEEIPSSKKLKASLNRDDVVFISISFDINISTWLKSLKRFDIEEENYWVDLDSSRDKLSDEFRVYKFPTYWIVGPDGKIINPLAKRPSAYLRDNDFLTL